MTPVRFASLATVAALVLGATMPLSGTPALGAPPASKHCKFVKKKVHGHQKKVRVCKQNPPLFNHPSNLVIDARGNVLVADQGSHRILVLNTQGKIQARWTAAGTHPTGFDQLYGIALDSSGNVYVTDAANRVLDKLDASGHPLAQWSTDLAEKGSFPTLLAVGSSGDVYLADHTAEAIVEISPQGKLLGEIGKGILGDPYGVTIGPHGDLYVADLGASRVREFGSDGKLLATWGDGAGGTVSLQSPEAIVVDAQGVIYVSEQSNHVVKFDSTGKRLADWGVTNKRALNDPSGLALDASGNLYVVSYEGNSIDKLSPSGKVLATWR